MTPAQFVLAVGADQRWIRNVRRLLGRAKRDDAYEARWLGVVHDLQASLGVALEDAARMADRVLGAEGDAGLLEVGMDSSASIRIVADCARLRTLHDLRLARALYLPVLDHRGRPATSYRPIVAELARGVRRSDDARRIRLNVRLPAADRLAALGSLGELLLLLARAGVRFIVIGETAGALCGTLRRPEAVDVLHDVHDRGSLNALADVLNELSAAPRGGRRPRPGTFDVPMLGAIPALALDTRLGALNLWTRCHVIGDYPAALTLALDDSRSGFPFLVLDLEALMAMERGYGRATDKDLLFELKQIGIERQRLARLERYRRSTSSSCATTFG